MRPAPRKHRLPIDSRNPPGAPSPGPEARDIALKLSFWAVQSQSHQTSRLEECWPVEAAQGDVRIGLSVGRRLRPMALVWPGTTACVARRGSELMRSQAPRMSLTYSSRQAVEDHADGSALTGPPAMRVRLDAHDLDQAVHLDDARRAFDHTFGAVLIWAAIRNGVASCYRVGKWEQSGNTTSQSRRIPDPRRPHKSPARARFRSAQSTRPESPGPTFNPMVVGSSPTRPIPSKFFSPHHRAQHTDGGARRRAPRTPQNRISGIRLEPADTVRRPEARRAIPTLLCRA